jgi:hypothetical protein
VFVVDKGLSVAALREALLLAATSLSRHDRITRRDGLIGSYKSRPDQRTSQSVREGSRISAISSTTGRVLLGLLLSAQDSACFSGAVFPEAAFASPMSVRVFFDAKTSWKEGFHGNLQAAGSCLCAVCNFFLCRPVF